MDFLYQPSQELSRVIKFVISAQLETTQEEYENTQNALAKEELKNNKHKEEIQGIVDSAETLKVRDACIIELS